MPAPAPFRLWHDFSMSEDASTRRATARANADYHAEALRRRREQEAAAAQVLVDQFVVDARAAGLPEQELTARPYKGSGRYRTGITGWYLKRDHSIGVGSDGGYYILVVAPSLRARFGRAELSPVPPPLQVGVGARDGESMTLRELLALRLSAGPDFP